MFLGLNNQFFGGSKQFIFALKHAPLKKTTRPPKRPFLETFGVVSQVQHAETHLEYLCYYYYYYYMFLGLNPNFFSQMVGF